MFGIPGISLHYDPSGNIYLLSNCLSCFCVKPEKPQCLKKDFPRIYKLLEKLRYDTLTPEEKQRMGHGGVEFW
jgi:hypothetical protein